jgi:2'-5' RNA ligase
VLRCFIAIELPVSIQEAIHKQTARLRRSLGNDLIRWIPVSSIHLTLKFLGDVPPAHIDFLKQMLATEAQAHSSFDMQIAGLGAFPNSKRPRVLWLGLQAPASLPSLQQAIEAGCARLAYPKEERAFSPHLTLGRVRQGLAAAELQKTSQALDSIQLGNIATVRVDSVHLFKSDLRPQGPVYTKLFTARLKTASTAEA